MFYINKPIISLILYAITVVKSDTVIPSIFSDPNILDDDIVKLLNAKSYIPNDEELSKISIPKSNGDDAVYYLSKLSDNELIEMLNDKPRGGRNNDENEEMIKLSRIDDQLTKNNEGLKYDPINQKKYESQVPVFKLNHQEVDPYAETDDLKYNAYKKIKNILHSHPQGTEDSDEKREMLFDVLVSQLKSLCCKRNKPKIQNEIKLPDKFSRKEKSRVDNDNSFIPRGVKTPMEYIFLLLNDEIKSNTSDDLIFVDPDSLANNSTALLLGPITSPLPDVDLKVVVKRIANEISRPEYLPLLHQLAEGTLSDQSNLLKSVVTGPETRRYIKPHRCNHQSQLSRVYGGPQWLICTGYINLNTPSLYD